MEIKSNTRFYNNKHLWAEKDECGNWAFGISKHGSDELAGIVYVEAAQSKVSYGETFITIESRKATVTLECPFPDGMNLYATNHLFELHPEKLDELMETESICAAYLKEYTMEDMRSFGFMSREEYLKRLEDGTLE